MPDMCLAHMPPNHHAVSIPRLSASNGGEGEAGQTYLFNPFPSPLPFALGGSNASPLYLSLSLPAHIMPSICLLYTMPCTEVVVMWRNHVYGDQPDHSRHYHLPWA